MAHGYGAVAEAELEHIGRTGVEDGQGLTQPEAASRFVAETGIDILAASVGTTHGLSRGLARIDHALLAELRDTLPCHLALHGGTGAAPDDLVAAIRGGVVKVSYFHGAAESALLRLKEADRRDPTRDDRHAPGRGPTRIPGQDDRDDRLLRFTGSSADGHQRGDRSAGRMSLRILAVDLGTSGCKVGIFEDGVLTGTAAAPVSTDLQVAGWAEQDPDAWWSILVGIVRVVHGQLGRPPIDAIAIVGQSDSLVALDASGRAVHPCILWMDGRGVDELRRAVDEVGLDVVRRRTGLRPGLNFTAPKAAWLCSQPPGGVRAHRVAGPAQGCVGGSHDWQGGDRRIVGIQDPPVRHR